MTRGEVSKMPSLQPARWELKPAAQRWRWALRRLGIAVPPDITERQVGRLIETWRNR